MISVSTGPVRAQQASVETFITDQKETLKGIKGVKVVVENLSEDATKGGLTKEQIQTDVEVKLRTAGIRIYDQSTASPEATSEWLAKGGTCLYVRVSAQLSSLSPTIAVFTEVELEEEVRLYDDPSKVTVAAIWKAPSHIGLAGTERFQEGARQEVKGSS